MATPAIKVELWKAVHDGGTKFYHVVRFIAAHGKSLSIRHYGPTNVFTGLGKISTGQIELDENFSGSTNAGLGKIGAKKGKGYRGDEEKQTVEFSSIAACIKWMNANFGMKAQGIARPVLSSVEWKDADTVSAKASASPLPRAPKEKPESDAHKHEDWNSW